MAATRKAGRRPRASAAFHAREAAIVVVVAAALAAAVWLIPTAQHERSTQTPSPTPAPVLAGADVSWPSCRHPAKNPMPGAVAFGIVGVNDGEPNTRNPCLAEQVAWAAAATGGTAQPRVGYYAMAADPFSPWESKWATPIWPTDARWRGGAIPIPAAWGACHGNHAERGCAYLFGWETAWRDAHLEGVVDPADATWWIDVETQRDFSADPEWNEALIEGMAAGFTAPVAHGGVGARAGIYSNAYFWAMIVGGIRPGSPLDALPNWYPIGAASREDAAAALRTLTPLTPHGRIAIVQHVEGGVDRNVAAVRR